MSNINIMWEEFVTIVTEKVEKEGLDNFLQWSEIKHMMFHYCQDLEFNALNPSEWCVGLQEHSFGNPDRYASNKYTSPNLIHQAYNLSQLRPNGDISDIKSVFEFGGGYGCFCRLCHNLGFKGTYTIYDLPLLSKIQKGYVENTELKNANVVLTSKITKQEVDLFVATWSINECPEVLRDEIFNNVSFKNCIIAYHGECGGDNIKYFKKLTDKMPEYTWTTTLISHLSDEVNKNYYLTGVKND